MLEKKNWKRGKKIGFVATERKCMCCKQLLLAEEFIQTFENNSGLNSTCRACQSTRESYADEWRDKKRKEGKCAGCGYCEDFRALEFAHLDRRNKLKNRHGRSVQFSGIWSIKKLEEEWKKLLCTN